MTIYGGRVVADQEVVLHSLRVGVCGYADGHRVDVFSKDIPLKETRLANGGSYNLGAGTVRVPFTKTPPAMNCLCSILSGSPGNSAAEALGSVDFPSQRVANHQTTLVSHDTAPKIDEFWKRTKPAEWSDSETDLFLTKSPWVHYYGHVLAPSCVVGPGGRHAMVPAPDMAIRWESAAMMREALARVESKDYNNALAEFSKDYYVIVVIHMMKGMDHGSLTSHWSQETEDAPQNRSATQNALSSTPGRARIEPTDNQEARQPFTSTRLLTASGEPISPAHVESVRNSEGTVNLLMFPRSLAIEKSAGDVDLKITLWVGMGLSTVDVKFSLKDLAEGVEQGL